MNFPSFSSFLNSCIIFVSRASLCSSCEKAIGHLGLQTLDVTFHLSSLPRASEECHSVRYHDGDRLVQAPWLRARIASRAEEYERIIWRSISHRMSFLTKMAPARKSIRRKKNPRERLNRQLTNQFHASTCLLQPEEPVNLSLSQESDTSVLAEIPTHTPNTASTDIRPSHRFQSNLVICDRVHHTTLKPACLDVSHSTTIIYFSLHSLSPASQKGTLRPYA